MSDRDLLLDLAMKTGNLLQHPMSPQARAAARNSIARVNNSITAERLNRALDAIGDDDQKPSRLPYKD